MLEVIIVIVVAGILSAIAAISWTMLLNTFRLNTANDEVFQAIRTAQQNAKRNRIDWQASFRQTNGVVQWAVHPDSIVPQEFQWKSLDQAIRLDNETTLRKVKDVYQVQFNHLGAVHGQLGRITLSGKIGGRAKRCVIVSTLLGTLRTSADRTKPVDNKYCY